MIYRAGLKISGPDYSLIFYQIKKEIKILKTFLRKFLG